MSTSWFSSSSAPVSIANGFGTGTSGQLLTSNGGTAPSWTTVGTSTPTANTIATYDANTLLHTPNVLTGLTLQSGNLNLTLSSPRLSYRASNGASISVFLPDATTCSVGQSFYCTGGAASNGTTTIRTFGGTSIFTLVGTQACLVFCISTASDVAASWTYFTMDYATVIKSIVGGGTGSSTASGAFNNLSPMTTGGDIIYGGASGTGTRLANGTTGQVLTSAGGTAAPTWTNPGTGTVTSVAATVPAFLSVAGTPITTSGTLAFTLSGTALPIANGGTGVTSVTSSTTASSWAGWDANGLLYANSLVPANVITSSNQTYVASGAGTQLPGLITSTSSGTIVLTFPDHSTMQAGRSCRITNIGSGICGVHEPNGGSPILVVDTYPGMSIIVTCINPGAGSALDAWTVERLTNVPIGASLPANPYITNQGTAVILPNSNTTYNMNNKWPNLIVCDQSSGYASFVLPNPSTIPSGTKYTFRLTLSGNPLSVNTFTSATQIILMSGTDFNPAREVDIWWNGFNWVNRWFGYGTTVQNAQGNGENAD
jgi:hypothetical protein